MTPTLRTQNRCGSCEYEWFPRGKSRSLKCPNCGSKNVLMPVEYHRVNKGLKKNGIRLIVVGILMCFLGVWVGSLVSLVGTLLWSCCGSDWLTWE